eukprot:SAG22_NODE_1913_length_3322_cov_2.699969_2_plen_46_part_00
MSSKSFPVCVLDHEGLLTGLIGDHGGAMLEIISETGDVSVKVIAG